MLLFGTAFGALAVDAGLAAWLAVLASLIVVSGAAQFTLVALLAAGAGPVLVATTGLALRHVPMSARLAGSIGPRATLTRAALAWVLVDETFGMTIAAEQRGETDLVGYKFGADIVLYGGFVASTVAGAVIGSAADPEAWGAAVFFPLVFVGLAAPLVRSGRDWLVTAAAVAAALVAVEVLPTAWQITGAAAVAAAVGATRHE